MINFNTKSPRSWKDRVRLVTFIREIFLDYARSFALTTGWSGLGLYKILNVFLDANYQLGYEMSLEE